MSAPRITRVKAIGTPPDGIRLVVATFTRRPLTVVTTIEQHLEPRAANLRLDLACYNFGVQERHVFGERTREVFPGCPGRPFNGAWPPIRRLDGTVIRP